MYIVQTAPRYTHTLPISHKVFPHSPGGYGETYSPSCRDCHFSLLCYRAKFSGWVLIFQSIMLIDTVLIANTVMPVIYVVM
ncbi:hypothetical protein FKM82_021460 [Ascaphus truei]